MFVKVLKVRINYKYILKYTEMYVGLITFTL